VRETFYAVTPSRRFPNPLVAELVQRIAEKPTTRPGKAGPTQKSKGAEGSRL
jgi:mannitol-1-phosphate/altronate dehydrogenase